MAGKTKRTPQQIGRASKQKGARFELKLPIILEITVIRKPAERLSVPVRATVRLMLREFLDYGLNVNIRKRCSFIHG